METTLDGPDQSWNRLRKTIADLQVAVFLGAGVSAANCMPNWRDFIGALGEWTPEQMQTFLKSDLSLESLCEIAKRRVGGERWSERVRNAIQNLRRFPGPPSAGPSGSQTPIAARHPA